MPGVVGLVTRNGVDGAFCAGLFGGAGFVTASVHAPAFVKYAALIVACRTLRLNKVDVRVIGGFGACWIATTDVAKKLSPYTVTTGSTVGAAITLAGKIESSCG